MITNRIKGLPRIQLDEKHLPYKWQEHLIEKQEIGGVFLLFLSGKNKKEIKDKVKAIKRFVRVKDFATITPKWEGTIGGDPNNPFPLRKQQ